eukprot:12511974-Alexandrium_andersonii.AAC.1
MPITRRSKVLATEHSRYRAGCQREATVRGVVRAIEPGRYAALTDRADAQSLGRFERNCCACCCT